MNLHKLQHKRFAPIFMYGVEIPRDWHSVRRLNKENGNTKWADSDQLELKQLFDDEFAIDIGKINDDNPQLKGYTKI